MGIDANLINHTRKQRIWTGYRLHSFEESPWKTWLEHGPWKSDEVEVLGDGNESDDYVYGTHGWESPGRDPYEVVPREPIKATFKECPHCEALLAPVKTEGDLVTYECPSPKPNPEYDAFPEVYQQDVEEWRRQHGGSRESFPRGVATRQT